MSVWSSQSFDRETEARYLSDLTAFYVPMLRATVSFVVLFYLFYLGCDWLLFQRYVGTGVNLLMLAVAAPAAMAGIAVTFFKVSDRMVRTTVFAATLVNGLCQVWSYDIGFRTGKPIPYEGMILVMCFAYFMLGMQLRTATVLSISIAAAHLLVSWQSRMPAPMLFDHATMMLSVVFIGTLSGQVLDQFTRRNWVNEGRLREQSERDPLTGLYNRRHLNEQLPRRLVECRRTGRKLSLLMIDIDHFKRINDEYGHDAGDEVLRVIAAHLRHTLRAEDTAFRLGGEEFVLLIENLDDEAERSQAHACAERICSEVEALQIRHQNRQLPTITLSIGIAQATADVIDTLNLLHRADAALYAAKRAGRNRVCHLAVDE